jgi:hypothetical protein
MAAAAIAGLELAAELALQNCLQSIQDFFATKAMYAHLTGRFSKVYNTPDLSTSHSRLES